MPDLHINDEQLDLYALGRLPATDVERIEEHLLICEPCQARLRQADEFTALFRSTATLPDARPRRRWWLAPRIAAGAATAVITAGVVFVVAQRPRSTLAPAVVVMQSLRGPEAPAQIPAGKPALLIFDLTTPAAQARVVDLAGKVVLTPPAEWKDGRLTVSIDRLPRGSYWVRVYGQDAREPIAEYGLQAK